MRIWDAANGAVLAVLHGHQDRVESVAYSPDGRRIVSGSHDKTVRVWDAERGAVLAVLPEHESWVNSVAYSPDGQRIVSGAGRIEEHDNTARVWDGSSADSLTMARELGKQRGLFGGRATHR